MYKTVSQKCSTGLHSGSWAALASSCFFPNLKLHLRGSYGHGWVSLFRHVPKAADCAPLRCERETSTKSSFGPIDHHLWPVQIGMSLIISIFLYLYVFITSLLVNWGSRYIKVPRFLWMARNADTSMYGKLNGKIVMFTMWVGGTIIFKARWRIQFESPYCPCCWNIYQHDQPKMN